VIEPLVEEGQKAVELQAEEETKMTAEEEERINECINNK
jgi:hypothetical protein